MSRRTSVALPGPSAHTATMRPWAAGSTGSTYAKSPAPASGASVSSPTRSANVSGTNAAPGRRRSPQTTGPLPARFGARPHPVVGQRRHRLGGTGGDRGRDDDIAASAQLAEAGCVAAMPSNLLRTPFVPMASTRRSPNAGSIHRRTLNAYVFRVSGFERSAQSARNVRAKLCTFGAVSAALSPTAASASNARAATRAYSTVSASSVPSVRLTTELLHRRRTIHVMRPFGRARSPSPGAALSHSLASVRRREGAGARHRDLRSVRHGAIPSGSAARIPASTSGRILGDKSSVSSISGNSPGLGARWTLTKADGPRPSPSSGCWRSPDADAAKCSICAGATSAAAPSSCRCEDWPALGSARRGRAGAD